MRLVVGDVFELLLVWLVTAVLWFVLPGRFLWLVFVPLALWSVAFVVQARFKGGVAGR